AKKSGKFFSRYELTLRREGPGSLSVDALLVFIEFVIPPRVRTTISGRSGRNHTPLRARMLRQCASHCNTPGPKTKKSPPRQLGGLIFWMNHVPVVRCQLASRTSTRSAETLEPVPRPNLKGPRVDARVVSFLATAAKGCGCQYPCPRRPPD